MRAGARWRVWAVLASAILAPLALAAGACAASRMDVASGTVDGHLRPCPAKPNCVCSEDPREAARAAPLAFEGDPAEALRSLVALLREEPRVELVSVGDDYVHAIFRSRLFRFPDDVELRLDPAARVIHVRSAARLGYSDFGVNRRRVESLRSRWSAGRGGG